MPRRRGRRCSAQDGLKPEQVEFSERYQPGGTRRPPHPLTRSKGASSTTSGCAQCHSVGKPNDDGTIGTCTACHTRHTSSVAIARLPTTCGQCHLGPDHSQLEIYEESKHGVMFHAQERLLKLDAPPKTLTTRDMFVPTCATCHMSGLNGQKVTHDPSERLSYYLADSDHEAAARTSDRAQVAMKQICVQCHTRAARRSRLHRGRKGGRDHQREGAAGVGHHDRAAQGRRAERRHRSRQPIDFVYFDLWHYDGRTSKHGAFMGGADFVQWHGNYPMLARTVELRAQAEELRRQHGTRSAAPARRDWRTDHQLWIELFVAVQLRRSGRSTSFSRIRRISSARVSEYVPLVFSAAATAVLAVVVPLRRAWPTVWRDVGHLVGWLAVAGRARRRDSASRQPVLRRAHDQQPDLRGAVRRAARLHRTRPAAASPTGWSSPRRVEWAQWVLLLALGGFIGNFVFSLTDHAQNGFFNPLEWVPVVSSAFAIGFLLVPFVMRVDAAVSRGCARPCCACRRLSASPGSRFTSRRICDSPAPTLFERVLSGAPPMAPLLFPNLVVLGWIALWTWTPHLKNSRSAA